MSLEPRQGKPEGPAASEAAWAKRRAAVSTQIEKAALELFVARGVDGVTVEEIAAAAGISRRTFYRYFDTPDHVIIARPHRSLARIWQDVHARPLDEPILESLIAALRNVSRDPEDVEIGRLSLGVMRRSPEAWARSVGRMHPSATEVYRDLIADRLRACGRDPAPSGVFAAAITALLMQSWQENESVGVAASMDAVESALRSFAALLTEAGPLQPPQNRIGKAKAKST